MSPADDEMTTAEAGELLKISTAEIRVLCRNGIIHCRKDPSGRWYLSRTAVADYISARLHDLGQPE